jgi:hypothetical protein
VGIGVAVTPHDHAVAMAILVVAAVTAVVAAVVGVAV